MWGIWWVLKLATIYFCKHSWVSSTLLSLPKVYHHSQVRNRLSNKCVPHLGSSVRLGLFALKLLVGPVAPHLNKLRMDFCSSQGYPIISRYSWKCPPEYIFESLLWSSVVVKTNRCFEFRGNTRQVAVARWGSQLKHFRQMDKWNISIQKGVPAGTLFSSSVWRCLKGKY